MPTVLYEEKLGAPFAEALIQVTRHACVQCESHVRTPENANTILGAGQADLVSIVRGQIADPHMANKALAGRDDAIRPCLSCNQMCWGRRYRDYWISCLVNPSAGREFEWGGDRFTPADSPRKILVVGGGPAGLEVARVAAERGHGVTLAEAGPELGGRFRYAGLQPRRGQITDLIGWWTRELERLGVGVHYNTPIDADDVPDYGADAVVVATGSLPSEDGFQRALPHVERLPGIESGNVVAVDDVMGRSAHPGRRVIVLDDLGHWHGAGTAWHLAEAGHDVTVVTRHPTIGAELARTAADGPLRTRLKRLGVRELGDSAVTAWHGDGADVMNLLDGATDRIEADTLVTATVGEAQTWLANDLTGSGMTIHTVGDCVAPRLAVMAIYEGRELGQRL